MMQVAQLLSRIWDGDPNEYFSYKDMNRVEYNANILAKYAGVPEQTFDRATRSSQFMYDEAQKLENLIREVGNKLGIKTAIEPHWNYNRIISYVDFERWESESWKLYKALGGVGDRVPSDKSLHTIHALLFTDAWRGAGPYYQDIDVSSITMDSEAIVYVSEYATAAQRRTEYNAVLQAVHLADRKMRVYAHSIKPHENIPIKITTKAFKLYKSLELKANAWQGSGPWTQKVDLGTNIANAVIGSDNRNSPSQVQAFLKAIIGVSAMEGTMVTIRAIGEKPTIDINAAVMWSEEHTE